MPDAFEAGAPVTEAPSGGMPQALTLPVRINVRNADQKIDANGKASHLDGSGFAAEISDHVAQGTVLFTTLFLDSINSAARGLAKVRSASTAADGQSCDVVADWVDLNPESQAKIDRILSGGAMMAVTPRGPIVQHSERALYFEPSAYQHGVPHESEMGRTEGTTKRYFEPAPLRPIGKPTGGTRFWNSLSVTAYIAIALIILAFFPATRKIELSVWHSFAWGVSRLFYWMTHINQVRLYNNS